MGRCLTTLLRVLGLLWWEQCKGQRYQRSYHPRTARRASGGVLAAARGRFSPPAPPLCLAAPFPAAPRAFAPRLSGSFVCLGWPPSSALCGLRCAAVGGLRRHLLCIRVSGAHCAPVTSRQVKRPRGSLRSPLGIIVWVLRLRRRRRFAVKLSFGVFFCRFAFWWRGCAVPPVVFSVRLRRRSFWWPFPPPFGRLRPCRRAPPCDRAPVRSQGWGFLWALSSFSLLWAFCLGRLCALPLPSAMWLGGVCFRGFSRPLGARRRLRRSTLHCCWGWCGLCRLGVAASFLPPPAEATVPLGFRCLGARGPVFVCPSSHWPRTASLPFRSPSAFPLLLGLAASCRSFPLVAAAACPLPSALSAPFPVRSARCPLPSLALSGVARAPRTPRASASAMALWGLRFCPGSSRPSPAVPLGCWFGVFCLPWVCCLCGFAAVGSFACLGLEGCLCGSAASRSILCVGLQRRRLTASPLACSPLARKLRERLRTFLPVTFNTI